MSAPTLSPEQIPAELQAVPQWACWTWITDATGRRKLPLTPSTGRAASSTDPATWGTLAAALAAVPALGAAGVSFALSPADPYVGVDVDHCVAPDGTLSLAARLLLSELCSYAEISPSGTGLRVFCRGTLPPEGRKRGDYECYERDRFLTVTGAHIPGTPRTVEERTAALARAHARIWPEHHAPRPLPAPPVAGLPMLSDQDILQRALTARNGPKFAALYRGDTSLHGGDDSDADCALCGMLAFWTADAAQVDRLFRGSGLMRPKWDTRRGHATYGARTITHALGGTLNHYTGPLAP